LISSNPDLNVIHVMMMVLMRFMATGKLLPSARKKVVSPMYNFLSQKMREMAKHFDILCHLNYYIWG